MTTFRGRGRIGPCHDAVGEGSYRFTGAFSRGRRFFTSSNLAVHPPETLSKFYLAAGQKRRGHHLSMQPVDQVVRSLAGLGPCWVPCFAMIIGWMGCSTERNHFLWLRRLAGIDGSARPVTLGFPSLLGKAGFLPGVALRPLLPLWQAFTRGIIAFSRARGGGMNSAWRFGEVRCLQIARLAFSSFLAAPFLTSSLAARVALRRWLSSTQEEEPFVSGSTRRPWPRGLTVHLRFIGLPNGEAFRRGAGSRFRIAFVSFEAADL